MDYTEWIGTRWEARCAMRLPKGNVGVGDTFTYDAACAALKLDPVAWLAVGNAVQLEAAPSLAETVEVRGGKRRRDAFAFESNPLVEAPTEAATEPTDSAAEGGAA
jgi:hypothetical protein